MAGGAEIGHLRGLVELCAHTVAHKVPHHGEPVALHILLHSVGDVRHTLSSPGILDALPEALLRDLDQAQGLLAHLPTGEGGGAVAVKTIDEGSHVYADDVALLEHHLLGGDAMDDHIVHRDAGGPGEAAVSQEGRPPSLALDELAHRGIYL